MEDDINMKMIYNEGRVIGYSSYDLYVRQFLSINPEGTPLSEREWLASSLSDTSSMILKIPAGTLKGFHDYPLPIDSQLCGCTLIYGSIFGGDVKTAPGSNWAIQVTDYGRLISNTDSSHPESPGEPENVPTQRWQEEESDLYAKKCKDYCKISSGVIIQPGTWSACPAEEGEEGEKRQAYELTPDFSRVPFVRLYLSNKTETDICVLLHGFSNKVAVKGSWLPDQVIPSSHAADGDFLGPAKFPWTCPIVFVLSTDIESIINSLVDDVTAKMDFRLKVLENHVNYLGTFHTVTYSYPIIDEEGHIVVIEKTGTVTQMWEDYGTSNLPYWVPMLTEEDDTLLTEDGQDFLGVKWGSYEEMIIEGGIL